MDQNAEEITYQLPKEYQKFFNRLRVKESRINQDWPLHQQERNFMSWLPLPPFKYQWLALLQICYIFVPLYGTESCQILIYLAS